MGSQYFSKPNKREAYNATPEAHLDWLKSVLEKHKSKKNVVKQKELEVLIKEHEDRMELEKKPKFMSHGKAK